MSDCIFCSIVARDIPSSTIYEDENILAFLDITQVTKGHTLVITKQHFRNLLEMDQAASATLFAKIPVIAKHLKDTLGATGVNLISNMEAAAGQTVFHTHIHLLPRFDEQDGLHIAFETKEPDFSALAQLADQLRLEKL
ncbi:HIT domain-containing protein [Streptococcus sp. zg-86]|uniref:HIT domain-containing protein n=1 Tax=Streptococcus zhangguiae TaxID=2664091 RepID=A0A6I4RDG0_9STRE|nr:MULTISPECIES: HIT family protein [unclassified Streptococcus]MTB63653.1 HIT domain-containing protein [Streptococcus sp. zg-86]MTB89963.1 HIT domain-containing protein [Streptococcus sp. zg-36]MWV55634.1 HIT domain-containing protein [Streptococcus sp. zg-70]QTH48073.1 HIT family protein [Streptococcus sp. zg-86]